MALLRGSSLAPNEELFSKENERFVRARAVRKLSPRARRGVRVRGRTVKPSPDRPVDKYLRLTAVVNNVSTNEPDN